MPQDLERSKDSKQKLETKGRKVFSTGNQDAVVPIDIHLLEERLHLVLVHRFQLSPNRAQKAVVGLEHPPQELFLVNVARAVDIDLAENGIAPTPGDKLLASGPGEATGSRKKCESMDSSTLRRL